MSSSNAGAAPSNHDHQGLKGRSPLKRPLEPLTRKLDHMTVPKRTLFSYSLLVFAILQVVFIILAAYCLARPLPLSLITVFSQAEVVGGFAVVFNVWQKIALGIGQYIADDILDREKPPGPPISPPTAATSPQAAKAVGEQEEIGSLVLGFLPWQVIHISKGRSSLKFKMAFFACMSIFALGSLAPGTIVAATNLIKTPTTIQIGQLLSQVQENETQALVTTASRASLILRLEKIEKSPFGFKLPPNMLAPLPRVNLSTFNATVEYDTDVIEFHHDCHWEAPQFFNVSGSIIIASAGQQWGGATVGTGPVSIGEIPRFRRGRYRHELYHRF